MRLLRKQLCCTLLVFAPARVLFSLSTLSLLGPVRTKDSRRDKTVAGKVVVEGNGLSQLYLSWLTVSPADTAGMSLVSHVTKKHSIEQPLGHTRSQCEFKAKPEYRTTERCRSLVSFQSNCITIC